MPDAAIVIPTHNRAEVLRKLLESVRAQTVSCQVLVMDDASVDGTGEMVRRDFPEAKYYREEMSRGPTFQRNKGVEQSHAPIIFTIDDDCVMSSPRTVAQCIEAFDHPRVGAVTLPFANMREGGRLLTRASHEGGVEVTFDYFGGMIAFRREAFLAAGRYRTYLFMHVEEFDLSIRLLERGYVVRLGLSDPMEHWESPVRNTNRVNMLEARNHVLYCFFNVPWPYFPAHLLVTSINSLRIGRRKRAMGAVMRGLLRGYAGMFHEFFRRRPVSGTTYRLSRLLKSRHQMRLEEIEGLLPALVQESAKNPGQTED